MGQLSRNVTEFLDALNHPFRSEIEQLRHIIINASPGITENIKWNGPNYGFGDADRITMRIQPPKQIQLIFHRGAKKQEQPNEKIISTNSRLLSWKENDRAVATFKSSAEIDSGRTDLIAIVEAWIAATPS